MMNISPLTTPHHSDTQEAYCNSSTARFLNTTYVRQITTYHKPILRRSVQPAKVALTGVRKRYSFAARIADREADFCCPRHLGGATSRCLASKQVSAMGDAEAKAAALKSVTQDPETLKGLSEGLQSDRDVVLAAMVALTRETERDFSSNSKMNLLTHVQSHEELLGDRAFVLELVGINGLCLQHCNSKGRDYVNDREVLLTALRSPNGIGSPGGIGGSYNSTYYYDKVWDKVPKELKADKEVVLLAVHEHVCGMRTVPEELKADKDVALAFVTCSKFNKPFHNPEMELLPPALLADRDVISAAVSTNGRLLRYASESLRDDRELALIAVANGDALSVLSERLRDDKEVVMRALTSKYPAERLVDGLSSGAKSASNRLKEDKEVVLAAMEQNVFQFRFAAESLRDDVPFALQALEREGKLLSSCGATVKADREAVLTALRNGAQLQDAAESLRGDREMLLEAVKASAQVSDGPQDWKVVRKMANQFEAAAPELREDLEIVMAMVERGLSPGWFKGMLSERLKADRGLLLAMTTRHPDVLESAPKELCAEKAFALEAVQCNSGALKYLSKENQADPDVGKAAHPNLNPLDFPAHLHGSYDYYEKDESYSDWGSSSQTLTLEAYGVAKYYQQVVMDRDTDDTYTTYGKWSYSQDPTPTVTFKGHTKTGKQNYGSDTTREVSTETIFTVVEGGVQCGRLLLKKL
ncbi:hypothetical protein CYMTET_47342 [Cymbomonas tetramitiformis]|uniref:DUF4116 domain-containing protein n=1 Tax=Cymbomonas tetramitiformis TaxID=36881 RepID=A0AAE0BUF5_9CHLO|nr:hypothetical protein CYMTET_47342 [Cymbomonas tetramitiformis]